MALGRREAELMGGCGMASAMYGKVAACTLLCHDFAEYIHVLTGAQFTPAHACTEPGMEQLVKQPRN